MGRVFKAVLFALAVAAMAVAVMACGSNDIASPTSNIDMAKDEAMKASLLAIDTGIAAYIVTANAPPPVADQATIGAYVSPWPVNPWTNEPMKLGDDVGDYVYEVLGGSNYSLVGHLSDGEYSRP